MFSRIWASWYYGLIGVIVAVELIALFDRDDHTPTLTKLLVTEVPARVVLPFCAWLFLHFAARYYVQSSPYYLAEVVVPLLLWLTIRK